MFELPSAIFLIADGNEFRFARFYIVCEEVPLGTPESPLIVCGLSDTLRECPNVAKTRNRDASHGMEEIREFCFKEFPAVCLFWNFFALWSSNNITYHPKEVYAYCGSSRF